MKLEEAKIEGSMTKAEVEEAIADYLRRKTGRSLIKAEPIMQREYEEYGDACPTTKFVGYSFTLAAPKSYEDYIGCVKSKDYWEEG